MNFFLILKFPCLVFHFLIIWSIYIGCFKSPLTTFEEWCGNEEERFFLCQKSYSFTVLPLETLLTLSALIVISKLRIPTFVLQWSNKVTNSCRVTSRTRTINEVCISARKRVDFTEENIKPNPHDCAGRSDDPPAGKLWI